MKNLILYLFILIALSLLCIGFVTASTLAVGEKEIILNITYPREGEVYQVGDAIPRDIPISVLGMIDAHYGIQNITISNGFRETSCGFTPGNHSEILCDMKLDLSVSQISITALDKQGNTVRIVRNYSLEIYQFIPLKQRTFSRKIHPFPDLPSH